MSTGSKRAMRIRLGIFALVVLGLLGTLVVLFGSLPSFFRRVNHYTVRFTEAPGVSPGTPVRRSGVRIGEVSDVTLDEEQGIVRVTLAIDRKYSLRRNDQPMLTLSLLGGDASIDIIPRPPQPGEEPDRTPLEPGAELVGVRSATVSTLLSRASEVVPTTQETLNDIRKSIQRLERMAPVAEETMREYRDLARDARNEIPQLRRTNDEYRELASEARRALPELRQTNASFRALAEDARAALPEARQAADEYRELARDARRALPELRRTNEEVQKLARDVREALPEFRRTGEDIGTAARNWGRLGERLNVFVQTNEDKVVKAIDQLNRTLERAASVLNEDNQRNLGTALRNLSTASERFPEISRNADDILQQGRTTVRRTNDAIIKADQILTDLQPAAKEFSQRSESILRNIDEGLQELRKTLAPLTARGDKLAQDLEQGIERFNLLAGDLRALMRAIDQSDGTFRRFLTDPTLYNRIDATVYMVQCLGPRLDRILKDVETFADKIARHPEALGVGGAVRPGSGLKNPPSPPRYIHHGP
jgi:phospholipid/cholesterol/gamma-HCH transport system substrate-binding protein